MFLKQIKYLPDLLAIYRSKQPLYEPAFKPENWRRPPRRRPAPKQPHGATLWPTSRCSRSFTPCLRLCRLGLFLSVSPRRTYWTLQRHQLRHRQAAPPAHHRRELRPHRRLLVTIVLAVRTWIVACFVFLISYFFPSAGSSRTGTAPSSSRSRPRLMKK